VTAALAVYVNAMGFVFKIADDHLEIWGIYKGVGMTLGTDLEQGKITLPLIRLLQTADDAHRAQILDLLCHPHRRQTEALLPWLDQSDARQYTQQAAQAYRDQAIAALDVLDDSQAKSSLIAIAEFAIQRRF
ncbi:MAG: polyprenyl synthetase family protein, partial [Novipirellula sp. JB048]